MEGGWVIRQRVGRWLSGVIWMAGSGDDGIREVDRGKLSCCAVWESSGSGRSRLEVEDPDQTIERRCQMHYIQLHRQS